MTVCVPIKDLKDTAKFCELVQKEQEVIVTKNGYSKFKCYSMAKDDQINFESACAKLHKRLELAEKERLSGKVISQEQLKKALDEIRG